MRGWGYNFTRLLFLFPNCEVTCPVRSLSGGYQGRQEKSGIILLNCRHSKINNSDVSTTQRLETQPSQSSTSVCQSVEAPRLGISVSRARDRRHDQLISPGSNYELFSPDASLCLSSLPATINYLLQPEQHLGTANGSHHLTSPDTNSQI